MNHIYRSLYNKALGTWVAVPEIAKTHGKPAGGKSATFTLPSPRFALTALASALLLTGGQAWAQGGNTNPPPGTTPAISIKGNKYGIPSFPGDNYCYYDATAQSVICGDDSATVTNTHDSKTPKSVAIGLAAKVDGESSVAVGPSSKAEKVGSIAIGSSAEATNNQTIAIGLGAHAKGIFDISIGRAAAQNANSIGSGSNIAIGDGALKDAVNTDNNYVIGTGAAAKIDGQHNVAIGAHANAPTADPVNHPNGIKASNTIAIGQRSLASQNNSIALGNRTQATGVISHAIGASSRASGNYSLAAGYAANATGTGSIAVGGAQQVANKTEATANYAIALGSTGTKATGISSIAIGTESKAAAINAVAIGKASQANAADATAIGLDAAASKASAVALGAGSTTDTDATQENTATVNGITYSGFAGDDNVVAGDQVSVGKKDHERQIKHVAPGAITATSTDAINGSQLYIITNTLQDQIGKVTGSHYYSVNDNGTPKNNYNNDGATADRALAAGVDSQATAFGATAVGNSAVASNIEAVAVGTRANASNTATVAIGEGTKASGTSAIAIGLNTEASGDNAFVLGSGSTATPLNRIAKASGAQSVAIGYQTQALGLNSTAVGANATASKANATALGTGSNASGDFSTAITGGTAEGDSSISAGARSRSYTGNDIAIGSDAKSGKVGNTSPSNAIAIGRGSIASEVSTVAIGNGAKASKEQAVALGFASTTDTDATKVTSATVGDITYAGFTGHANVTPGRQISVGKAGVERQIKHVAPGAITASSTDAINGSQLYATNNVINNVAGGVKNVLGGNANLAPNGSITMGNIGDTGEGNIHDAIKAVNTQAHKPLTFTGNDGSTDRKLGQTLNISGGLASTQAASNTNVRTVAKDAEGKIEILIADAPTFAGKVSAKGLDAGGQKITGVAEGTEKTDAVNVDQLEKTLAQASIQNATLVESNSPFAYYDEVTNKQLIREVDQNTGAVSFKNADGTPYTGKPENIIISALNPGVAQTAIATRIRNVAPGKDSTDAVNVSQLKGAADALGGGAGINPNTGAFTAPNYTIRTTDNAFAAANNVGAALTALNDEVLKPVTFGGDSGTTFDRKLGQTINVKGGATGNLTDGNIGVVADGNNTLNVKLAENINLGNNGSVKTGNTTVNNAGVTIDNADPAKVVSVTNAGLNNGGNAITNVANNLADTETADTNPAGNSRADLAAKGNNAATVNDVLNSGFNLQGNGNDVDFVTHGDTINFINGQGTTAKVTKDPATGATNIAFDINAQSLTDNAQLPVVYTKADGSKVYKHTNGNFYDAPNGGGTQVPVGDIIASMQNANGSTTNPTTLANVKAGVNDTDGVNVSQLKGAAAALGGGAMIADGSDPAVPAGTFVAPQYTINKTDGTPYAPVSSVGEALSNLNDEVVKPITFAGDIGTNSERKLGQTLTIQGGETDGTKLSDNNIGVVSNGAGTLRVKLAKNVNLGADGSVTAGDTTINNDGLTINGGPSVTKTGIDAAGNKLTNLAAGTDDTDAVNLAQLKAISTAATTGSPVQYSNPSDPTVPNGGVPTNNVTFTGLDPNAPVVVSNVAAGRAATDAVNVNQLYQVVAANRTTVSGGKNITVTANGNNYIVSTSPNPDFESVQVNGKTYVDANGLNANGKAIRNVAAGRVAADSTDAVNGAQLHALNQRVGDVDKRARAGIASAMASAGLPQAYRPGANMVAAGAGHYDGQSAVAIGVSTISDNGKWIIKGTANVNREDAGVSVGLGYQW